MSDNKSDNKKTDNQENNIVHQESTIEELKKFPPDVREKVVESSLEIMKLGSFPIPDPTFSKFLDKCTSKQISTIIQHTENQNVRIFEDRKDDRKLIFKVIILSIIGFIGISLIFLLTKNQPLFIKLIEILIPAAGAAIGGWGWAQKKSSE